jgi:predicted transcriptional regulator
MSVKERAIRAIQELPEDADFAAVTERLEFIRAVDNGLEQARRGQVVTSDEARRRLSAWLTE